MRELACPKCRSTRLATVEQITGLAGCTVDADTGEIDWEGYTDVNWDTSTSETHPKHGGTLISCRECGHEWYPKVLRPKAAA